MHVDFAEQLTILIQQLIHHKGFDQSQTQQVIHIDPPSALALQGNTSTTVCLQQYAFFQLNAYIRDVIVTAGYVAPDIVIETPKMQGPHFTVCIKDIFDLNTDRCSSIKDCSDQIYQILSSQTLSLVSDWVHVGIFINITCTSEYIDQVIQEICSYGTLYGSSDFLKDQSYIIEYSSPNMGKQMGIWHLRSTIIGQILNNIIQTLGARTLRWNYLWDRGTPFGKLIYSLCYHYDLEWKWLVHDILTHPTQTMLRLYAGFWSIDREDKLEQAKWYFTLLEQGNPVVVQLREILRSATLVDFQYIYDQFGISFDVTHGESFTQQYLTQIEQDLTSAGYMTLSDGAWIVRFKKVSLDWQEHYIPIKSSESVYSDQDYEVLLIKKSDGSTLYATRDLALMKYKASLGYQHLYNVVWSEQTLHFKLVSVLAYALGYLSDRCDFRHISFGMYLQDGQKMSTRKGTIWRLSDLIDTLSDRIWNQFVDKHIDPQTNTLLWISSLIFQDIKNDRVKDINFDINAMTRLNGDTGVYLHYTFVRLQALLSKLPDLSSKSFPHDLSYTTIEQQLLIKMSMFPVIVIQSYTHLKPHLIAQYALGLVADINNRYSTSDKIIDTNLKYQYHKAYYIYAMATTVSNILTILHLPHVDHM